MNNLMYQALVPLTGVSVVSILVSKEIVQLQYGLSHFLL